MIRPIIKYCVILTICLSMACNSEQEANSDQNASSSYEEKEMADDSTDHDRNSLKGIRTVHLTEKKVNNLNMRIDTIPERTLTQYVNTNGELKVPPQHEATVTPMLGANISSIKVIEGDKVNKGQVLAYVSHPDLTHLQSNYLKAVSELEYLEKEYERQKNLYEKEVGSGKGFQSAKADYKSKKAEKNGLETQLQQIGLNTEKIQDGEIFRYIPITAPIEGYIEKVLVQVGQYVKPDTRMFAIVNTYHVHADFMVFEKDVHKVKKGQNVTFTVESVPGEILEAEIYSVGKKFEKDPKALHVHTEIKNKKGFLIPGMYINGRIEVSGKKSKAVPEEAIIEENEKSYIFTAKKHIENGKPEWEFYPVEIKKGATSEGWVEIMPKEVMDSETKIALNGSYYLISEMQKSQTSHSH